MMDEEKPSHVETTLIELRRSSSSGASSHLLEQEADSYKQFGRMRRYGLRERLRISNLLPLLTRFVLASFRFAIPSFLRPQDGTLHKRVGGLAALDGLRGLACLFVSTYHFLEMVFTKESVNAGYQFRHGEHHGGPTATFWQWPFVKIIYAGPNMVSIFFVISGYVLAQRMLVLCGQGRVDKALEGMLKALSWEFGA